MGSVVYAYLHFLFIIIFVSMLIAEKLLYSKNIPFEYAKKLPRIDAVYGLSALAIAFTGFMRAMKYEKTWEVYAQNHIFWTKVGLFVVWALLSIPPTLHFLSWRKDLKEGKAPTITDAQYKRVRMCLMGQAAIFLIVPFLAALMARGYGLVSN